jgi:hypothetical protein
MEDHADNLLPQAMDLNSVLTEAEIFDMLMHTSEEAAIFVTNDQIGKPDCASTVLQISKDNRLKKNRIAQKKFRDRQKARMEQLQQELTQQKAIINKLAAENAVLKNSIAFVQPGQRNFETLSTESDLLVASKKDTFQSYASPTRDLIERSKSNEVCEELRPGLAASRTGLFLRNCWSRFAEEIQGLLAEYNTSPSEDTRLRAMERLSAHLKTGIQLYVKDMMSQRHLLQHCHATAYEDDEGLTSGSALKWVSVVQDMGLHKLQMDQIVALKDAFMPRIEDKCSEQHARLKDLQSLVAKLQRDSSLHLSSDDLDSLNDKALQVKASLQEKQECVFEFLLSFFQCDLQPVQMARCIARSYPDYPDVCKIAHVASELRLQLSRQEGESAE